MDVGVDDAARDPVRVRCNLVDLEHRCHARIERGESLYPFITGTRREATGELSPQLCLRAVVVLPIDPGIQTERTAEVPEERGLDGSHCEPLAVARLVHVVAGVPPCQQLP